MVPIPEPIGSHLSQPKVGNKQMQIRMFPDNAVDVTGSYKMQFDHKEGSMQMRVHQTNSMQGYISNPQTANLG